MNRLKRLFSEKQGEGARDEHVVLSPQGLADLHPAQEGEMQGHDVGEAATIEQSSEEACMSPAEEHVPADAEDGPTNTFVQRFNTIDPDDKQYGAAYPSGGDIRAMAVMFTDMAGSTEYAEKYGAMAARTKQQTHNRLLIPLVAEHNGTLIKTIGDALLVIFERVLDAARCAGAMQRRLVDYNHADKIALHEQQIHIRAGIHWGKAILYGEEGKLDIVGPAVNVAARVESGGGKQTDQILLSEEAYAQLLPYQDALHVVEFGVSMAKGVGPLRLFRLLWLDDERAMQAPLRLAAHTAAALETCMTEAENTRGIHCLFVDPASARSYIRPVFVRVAASADAAIRPRVPCDRVMEAAVTRAVRTTFSVMQRLGFGDARLDQHVVEWWVEGPPARYEGASLGLGIVLAMVAAYAGIPMDPAIVVTGATDGGRVVQVAGITGKCEAVGAHGFRTLVLPADNLAELAADAARFPELRLIGVSSVEETIAAVLGPTLGLGARYLAGATQHAAAVREPIGVTLWIQPDERGGTRNIAVVPDAVDHTWYIGDRIRICARTDRDGYLALFNVGPTGNVTILLPNSDHPETTVRAGQPVSLPAPQDRFSFQLQGPPGREKIIAIASARPLKLTPAAFKQSSQLMATPGAHNLASVIHDLAAEVSGRAEIEFYVSDKEREVEATAHRGLIRDLTGPPENQFRSIDLG